MKRFIQAGVIITIAFVLWQVSADARFLDLQKQEQVPAFNLEVAPTPHPAPPNPVYKSEVKPQGINLQFQDLTLLEVLRNIQEDTGILFSIDPSIESIPFNASIQADNWEEAVKELLKGFNRVEVWTNNLETSRVWVLEGGSDEYKSREPDIRLSRRAKIKSTPVIRTVSNNNPLDQLPLHIRRDPEILRFLYSKGMKMPTDIKTLYGDHLENLPPKRPMLPHVKRNAEFIRFLKANGLRL
jgi:hypothetical protein